MGGNLCEGAVLLTGCILVWKYFLLYFFWCLVKMKCCWWETLQTTVEFHFYFILCLRCERPLSCAAGVSMDMWSIFLSLEWKSCRWGLMGRESWWRGTCNIGWFFCYTASCCAAWEPFSHFGTWYLAGICWSASCPFWDRPCHDSCLRDKAGLPWCVGRGSNRVMRSESW